MIKRIDLFYAQSQNTIDRLEFFGAKNIRLLGNIKINAENYEVDLNKKAKFASIFDNSSTFKIVLGSSHDQEEEFVLNAWNQMPNSLLIIAPRHPERSTLIRKNYIKEGISANLLNESNSFAEDVFIINSFGNLPTYFAASDGVFLGGSFVDKGGHNPIEPAKNDCNIDSTLIFLKWYVKKE